MPPRCSAANLPCCSPILVQCLYNWERTATLEADMDEQAEGECVACENSRVQGHNYCRHCGYHLTAWQNQQLKKRMVWSVGHRFCGYCGKRKGECDHVES